MSSKTILIIDDDKTFLGSLAEILRNSGYAVLQAVDGREAIALIEKLRDGIHLIVVDLCLPGMNGFEVIGAVTRRKTTIKIIATTGMYDETYLRMAEAVGADASIRKQPAGQPVSAERWLRAIRRLLGDEQTLRAGQ